MENQHSSTEPPVEDLIANFLTGAAALVQTLNQDPQKGGSIVSKAINLVAAGDREWHPAAQTASGSYLKKLMRSRWSVRILQSLNRATLALQIERTKKASELRPMVLPLFQPNGQPQNRDETDVIEAGQAVWNSTLPGTDVTTAEQALKILTVMLELKERTDPAQLHDVHANTEVLNAMKGVVEAAERGQRRQDKKTTVR
jgi:hypothetical protein